MDQEQQAAIEKQFADVMNALPSEIRVLAAILTEIHSALIRIEDKIAAAAPPAQ